MNKFLSPFHDAWFCLGVLIKEGSVGDVTVQEAWGLRYE